MSLSVFVLGESHLPGTGDVRAFLAAGLSVRRLMRAELTAAAQNASTTTLVLLEDDARVDSATLAAVVRADRGERAIIGGRASSAAGNRFGSMLAPERFGPIGFAIAPLLTPPGERSVDALFAGPLDVIAAGLIVIPRALALEIGDFDPELEDVYALTDWCLRARGLGIEVRCDPSIVYARSREERVARRPLEAMQTLAARYPTQVLHHDSPGIRTRGISREIRHAGGVRMRVRKAFPPTTVVIHGAPPPDPNALIADLRLGNAPIADIFWAHPDAPILPGVERSPDALAAVRTAMTRRGDRYVALVSADRPPEAAWLDRLIEDIEWGSDVAIAIDTLAAPSRAALIALRLIPHHLVLADAGTLDDALLALGDALVPLRRAIRSREGTHLHARVEPITAASTSVIFLASSKPEVVRSSFEAIVGQTPNAREYVVVLPSGAETTRLLIATYPRVKIVPDAIDPGLAVGLNAAFAQASGDRVLVLSDEYLFSPGTIAALVSAFDRDPALGIAVPRTNGGEAPQGIYDMSYGDMTDMQRYAAQRLDRFRRELTFVDRVTSVALAIDRRLLESIGGFDERFGVNRFAVEDFALRAGAAGYRIAMCDDVFAHRFGVEYSLSAIGHADTDQTLWTAFRRKWGLGGGAIGAYDSAPLIDAGFDAKTQTIALRSSAATDGQEPAVRVTFLATIGDESSWNAAVDTLRAFFQAFAVDDPVKFVLGVARGGVGLGDVASRLRRILTGAQIDIDRSMNLELVAFDEGAELRALLEGDAYIAFGARDDAFAEIRRIRDRSRTALRAFVETAEVAR